MKVNGIIAEYNPFHNGHLYQLEESLRLTGADYTVVAMSGDFVQRGAPAIADKHVRAEMALRCGADLVLELPVLYAASSAESFAAGAVALLDRLGVVTHLCFGSECGDIQALGRIARFLLRETEGYRKSLQGFLRQGLSYPAARARALDASFPEGCSDLLSSPNNILGIDYLKALMRRDSCMIPVTIERIGSDYHDRSPYLLQAARASFPLKGRPVPQPAPRLSEKGLRIRQRGLSHPGRSIWGGAPISALAIREALEKGHGPEQLRPYLPEETVRLLASCQAERRLLRSDDFSPVLYYRLLLQREQGYEGYLDVSSSLSDRIQDHLGEFTGFEAFCDLLKTKEMTRTRISRCLTHILLGLEKGHMDLGRSLDHAPYARVLGFRRSAAPLLSAIKAHSSIPLVTRPARAQKMLPAEADSMLRQDILASHIYQGIVSSHTGQPPRNEFTTPLAIL